jgi:rhamnosyltransferase
MPKNAVCAVVVTYHPELKDVDNLAKVRSQVEALVVVDNGSSEERLTILRVVSRRLDFILIENSENLGIGAALNTGVRWAQSHGYKWVALFDQDSTPEPGFIDAMIDATENFDSKIAVAILTPRHIDRDTGKNLEFAIAKDGSPLTAITSGSFIPVEIFKVCGEFEEDLFIDRVDDEFSLRVRSFGYTIFLCRNAFLKHRIGEPDVRKILGIRRIRVRNHRPERRYYITRNRIIMVRRYWRHHTIWCLNDLQACLIDIVIIVLVESDRCQKLKMIMRGLYDGVTGRLGQVVRIAP